MKKLLVVTDLSVSSISAIYFAYKISQIEKATLVITHVYSLSKPKNWRPQRFDKYHNARKEFLLTKLNNLLNQIFNTIDGPHVNCEIDLQMNSNSVNAILNCVVRHKCTYMFVSNQVNAKHSSIKMISNILIAKSKIPVFSVPISYKLKKIDSICFASNMTNYQKEIKKIASFVGMQNIKIMLLHIFFPSNILLKANTLEGRLLKKTGLSIKIKYIQRSQSRSLSEDIIIGIKKTKPSLIVYFMDRSTQITNKSPNSIGFSISTFFNKTPILFFKR
ncbi:hypothetical protein ACFRAE_17335 [Sphingobacterium sp. HJSM2_6]|uniref:hypothetical protein n=1 Tax=Sphingobacterium sp. HJSM2_6 TaxID=3366264 RepID=UPI003BE07591